MSHFWHPYSISLGHMRSNAVIILAQLGCDVVAATFVMLSSRVHVPAKYCSANPCWYAEPVRRITRSGTALALCYKYYELVPEGVRGLLKLLRFVVCLFRVFIRHGPQFPVALCAWLHMSHIELTYMQSFIWNMGLVATIIQRQFLYCQLVLIFTIFIKINCQIKILKILF